MKTRFHCKVIVFIAILCINCSTQDKEPKTSASIEEAEKAIMQLDHRKAARLFMGMFEDDTLDPKMRAKAGQRLARMTWHLYGRLEDARQILKKGIEFHTEEFRSLHILSGIELEANNHNAAREAAESALVFARSRFERHDAYIAFAKTTLAEVVNKILSSPAGTLAQVVTTHRVLLQRSLAMLDTVVAEEPGQLIPSEVLLGLSLISQNGPKAYDAWCQYYRISESSPAKGMMEKPHKILRQILPIWPGQDLNSADHKRLVLALADSRFFTYAAMMAKMLLADPPRNEPEIMGIVAYQRFLEKLAAVTRAFYRETALEGELRDTYREAFENEARALWDNLEWEGNRPSFSLKRFYSEIQQRFGADVRMVEIAGYYGLNMGHRVVDEGREIEQYGKKAKLRYISLDFMVSNGYSGWFWDGRAQPGGWANNPLITQVRRAYADGGTRAWKFITDSLKRQESENEIARLTALDDSLATANPHAYLPGLALRIKYRSYNHLLDTLKARGLTNARLRNAFITEVDRRKLEASIFAHEGRHALDRRDLLHWTRTSAQKEFNAKLSEVGFSSDPFLAILGGILLSNIGDGTSHGQANERIMGGIVDWKSQYSSVIDGFDSSRPLLPQLDLLTDDQLREVFRAMDSKAN